MIVYQGGASLLGTPNVVPPVLDEFLPSPSTYTGGVLVTTAPVNGGNPDTIERDFITADLQGIASFDWYSLPTASITAEPPAPLYRQRVGQLQFHRQ